MRIIAGKLKGSTIYTTKKNGTRPLKDLVKESIFNLLKHSNKILFDFENSNILDLYAGTGSFGLECLSRKAESVYFVEKEEEALKILKKNIQKLKLDNKSKIFASDVLKFIQGKEFLKIKFDLIFCDPPFKNKNIKELLNIIFDNNILKKNGILILHRHKITKERFSDNFEIIDERKYGLSKIYFGKFLF